MFSAQGQGYPPHVRVPLPQRPAPPVRARAVWVHRVPARGLRTREPAALDRQPPGSLQNRRTGLAYARSGEVERRTTAYAGETARAQSPAWLKRPSGDAHNRRSSSRHTTSRPVRIAGEFPEIRASLRGSQQSWPPPGAPAPRPPRRFAHCVFREFAVKPRRNSRRHERHGIGSPRRSGAGRWPANRPQSRPRMFRSALRRPRTRPSMLRNGPRSTIVPRRAVSVQMRQTRQLFRRSGDSSRNDRVQFPESPRNGETDRESCAGIRSSRRQNALLRRTSRSVQFRKLRPRSRRLVSDRQPSKCSPSSPSSCSCRASLRCTLRYGRASAHPAFDCTTTGGCPGAGPLAARHFQCRLPGCRPVRRFLSQENVRDGQDGFAGRGWQKQPSCLRWRCCRTRRHSIPFPTRARPRPSFPNRKRQRDRQIGISVRDRSV